MINIKKVIRSTGFLWLMINNCAWQLKIMKIY